jgi:hypothetical protein
MEEDSDLDLDTLNDAAMACRAGDLQALQVAKYIYINALTETKKIFRSPIR